MLTTYAYDRCNRLRTATAGSGPGSSVTTFTHDAAGHRTRVESAVAGLSEYGWDAAGRMSSAEPASAAGAIAFQYNADGQRVVKDASAVGGGTAVGFLFDHKHLLHETEGGVGGEISKTYATTCDEEYGDLLGEEDGSKYTHQFDAQANTAALLDEFGQVAARFKYYAFGQVAAVSVEGDAWSTLSVEQWAELTVDAWANMPLEIASPLACAGGQKQYYLDRETQLYLLGCGNNDGGGRYYDAAAGRFLSEDPDRHGGGDVNLYAYVANNPVNDLDPSGHQATQRLGLAIDNDREERERREREQVRFVQYRDTREHPTPPAAAEAKSPIFDLGTAGAPAQRIVFQKQSMLYRWSTIQCHASGISPAEAARGSDAPMLPPRSGRDVLNEWTGRYDNSPHAWERFRSIPSVRIEATEQGRSEQPRLYPTIGSEARIEEEQQYHDRIEEVYKEKVRWYESRGIEVTSQEYFDRFSRLRPINRPPMGSAYDPSAGLPGHWASLAQGGLNVVQAAQNTLVGLANVAVQSIPVIQLLNLMGVNTTIPSSDWTRNHGAAHQYGGDNPYSPEAQVLTAEIGLALATLKLPLPKWLGGGSKAVTAEKTAAETAQAVKATQEAKALATAEAAATADAAKTAAQVPKGEPPVVAKSDLPVAPTKSADSPAVPVQAKTPKAPLANEPPNIMLAREIKTINLKDLGWGKTKFAKRDDSIVYILRDAKTKEALKAGKTEVLKVPDRFREYEAAQKFTGRELEVECISFNSKDFSTIKVETQVREHLVKQGEKLPWDNSPMANRQGRLGRPGPGVPGTRVKRLEAQGWHWEGENYVQR
jgi:RHS repeat-associated protein